MIRNSTEEEVSQIQAIGKSQGLFNYGHLIYKQFAKQNLSFVIELANRIVGYVIALPLIAGRGFCLQVGVSSECQNQGLGTKLISFIEDHMKVTYNIKYLFAHTLREKSLHYFKTKLAYRYFIELPGLAILCKEL